MMDDAPLVATQEDASCPPSGFRRVGGYCGSFIEHSGPLFGRLDGHELALGFRVLSWHLNPLANAHGGMLASLADLLLATGAMYRPEGWGRILPTVSLQMDFLAPAPLGAWVEGRSEVLKVTGSFLFAQGLVLADGQPAMRASGVLKLGPVLPGTGDEWDPLAIRLPAKLAHEARAGAGMV